MIRLSDALFLPRGRLSTILPIEKISWIQKNLVKLCNKAAKPIILSSQFLDSMITNPFPTRAEATDIHSAVMDGTDCLCLNQEVNYGKYPLESLETMNNICLAAE